MSEKSYETLSSAFENGSISLGIDVDLERSYLPFHDTMFHSPDYSAVMTSSDPEDDVYASIHSGSPDTEAALCFTCCDVITDQYFLQSGQHVWHEHCLRCCVCQASLDSHTSCYVKDDKIFCSRDFLNTFQSNCSSCFLPVESGDWVRSAGQHVYHLACFSCITCHRQLTTGEDFAIHDGVVFCRVHACYTETDHSTRRTKSKRFRTAFTDDQIAVLQKYFDLDPNPTGSSLDLIAEESGLARRVAQVWFQNARAKSKRTRN